MSPASSDRSAEVEVQDSKSVQRRPAPENHRPSRSKSSCPLLLTKRFLSQIGSSVSVISQPEIENRNAESVLQILRGVPGVEVLSSTGRRGGATSVFIRGGNSNYNLVMIDGIPGQTNSGGDFDFASIANGRRRACRSLPWSGKRPFFGSNAVAGRNQYRQRDWRRPAALLFSRRRWQLFPLGASPGGGSGANPRFQLGRTISRGSIPMASFPNDYYRKSKFLT